jgi:hypothetical protein
MVHDLLVDESFEWLPMWALSYGQWAPEGDDGVIEFDGLLLNGWDELPSVSLPPASRTQTDGEVTARQSRMSLEKSALREQLAGWASLPRPAPCSDYGCLVSKAPT